MDYAFSLAAYHGHLEVVKLLLEKGTPARAAISGAASGGDVDMVQLLLEHGANPDDGMSSAAQHGYAEILNLILPLAQAEINTANWLGQTPLDLAVQHGHEECAALLRASGGKRKGQ